MYPLCAILHGMNMSVRAPLRRVPAPHLPPSPGGPEPPSILLGLPGREEGVELLLELLRVPGEVLHLLLVLSVAQGEPF